MPVPRSDRELASDLLDQDDVVLLLRVDRFDLQRDRLADEIAELGEALRFLVEKEIDHRLRCENAELARIELLRLAHDLAQDFVADRARGLDFAATVAGGTLLAQD